MRSFARLASLVLAALAAVNASPIVIRADGNGTLSEEFPVEARDVIIDLQSRQNPSWNYNTQKIRGVNIGGWLVAEPWITPDLFDNTGDNRVIDEYTFGQYVGNARSRLQAHWASFITEDDFRQIASLGLNHVRIPIGYWAFETSAGEPYVRADQLDYLRKGVGWAAKYGLRVFIDLHGAPGSQNGFDNSGKKGNADWFFNDGARTRAKNACIALAQMFANTPAVTSIQLLNEPLTTNGAGRKGFTDAYWQDAYYGVRYANGNTPTNFVVGIHDGFNGVGAYRGFMQPPNFQAVMLDTHIYTMFDNGVIGQSQDQRLRGLCANRQSLAASQKSLWTVVGEWTPAFTDCAKYLNGRGVGARYDGTFPGSTYRGRCDGTKTGDGSQWSATYKSFLKRMFDTQRDIYERSSSGFMMWTWKAPQAADWSYKRLSELGVIGNLNDRGNVYC